MRTITAGGISYHSIQDTPRVRSRLILSMRDDGTKIDEDPNVVNNISFNTIYHDLHRTVGKVSTRWIEKIAAERTVIMVMIDNNIGAWTFKLYTWERGEVTGGEKNESLKSLPSPQWRGGCFVGWLSKMTRGWRAVHGWGSNNRELLAYQQQNSVRRPTDKIRPPRRAVHVFIRPYSCLGRTLNTFVCMASLLIFSAVSVIVNTRIRESTC